MQYQSIKTKWLCTGQRVKKNCPFYRSRSVHSTITTSLLRSTSAIGQYWNEWFVDQHFLSPPPKKQLNPERVLSFLRSDVKVFKQVLFLVKSSWQSPHFPSSMTFPSESIVAWWKWRKRVSKRRKRRFPPSNETITTILTFSLYLKARIHCIRGEIKVRWWRHKQM